jgi:hypothetical protein
MCKIKTILFAGLLCLLILLNAVGCNKHALPAPTPVPSTPISSISNQTALPTRDSSFNLIFSYDDDVFKYPPDYEFLYKNTLDTFNDTYAESDTSQKLILSQEDMNRIKQKMMDINFFNYPDSFMSPPRPSSVTMSFYPFSKYYFKVSYNIKPKELRWVDEYAVSSSQADNLRTLVFTIKDIINTSLFPERASNFDLRFLGDDEELDTFKGICTRDVYLGRGPRASTTLVLSQEEKQAIYQKMKDINFFDYPNYLKVQVPEGRITGSVTPAKIYYFKVKYDNNFKELIWDNAIAYLPNIYPKGSQADNLSSLINLIQDIFKSKDEYKSLPPFKAARI